MDTTQLKTDNYKTCSEEVKYYGKEVKNECFGKHYLHEKI